MARGGAAEARRPRCSRESAPAWAAPAGPGAHGPMLAAGAGRGWCPSERWRHPASRCLPPARIRMRREKRCPEAYRPRTPTAWALELERKAHRQRALRGLHAGALLARDLPGAAQWALVLAGEPLVHTLGVEEVHTGQLPNLVTTLEVAEADGACGEVLLFRPILRRAAEFKLFELLHSERPLRQLPWTNHSPGCWRCPGCCRCARFRWCCTSCGGSRRRNLRQ